MHYSCRSWILGFIPNPFVSYWIDENHAHTLVKVSIFGIPLYRKSTSVPLDGASPTVPHSICGFGNIIISNSSSETTWKYIWGVGEKESQIRNYKTNAFQENEPEADEVNSTNENIHNAGNHKQKPVSEILHWEMFPMEPPFLTPTEQMSPALVSAFEKYCSDRSEFPQSGKPLGVDILNKENIKTMKTLYDSYMEHRDTFAAMTNKYSDYVQALSNFPVASFIGKPIGDTRDFYRTINNALISGNEVDRFNHYLGSAWDFFTHDEKYYLNSDRLHQEFTKQFDHLITAAKKIGKLPNSYINPFETEAKKPQSTPDGGESAQESINEAPDDFEFSGRYILLPKLPELLFSVLHDNFGADQFLHQHSELYYRWINRGDIFCSVDVPVALPSQKKINIPLRSPVRGLVVETDIGFHNEASDEAFPYARHFTVLLPEGESPAIEPENLYREFYDAIIDNREAIFGKVGSKKFRRILGEEIESDDDLRSLLERECKNKADYYIYLPVTSRYFAGELDNIKRKRPECRKKLESKRFRYNIALFDYEQGRYRSAIHNFDLALPDHRDEEKHADACFQCGQKQSDIAKAKEYYQKSLKINPAHTGAREALGLKPPKETSSSNISQNNEKPENTGSTNQYATDADASSFKSADSSYAEELMQKWGLDEGYSRAQLDETYRIRAELTGSNVSDVNKEYGVLKQNAA